MRYVLLGGLKCHRVQYIIYFIYVIYFVCFVTSLRIVFSLCLYSSSVVFVMYCLSNYAAMGYCGMCVCMNVDMLSYARSTPLSTTIVYTRPRRWMVNAIENISLTRFIYCLDNTITTSTITTITISIFSVTYTLYV